MVLAPIFVGIGLDGDMLYLAIFVIFEPWRPRPAMTPFWSKMNA
jgi:hypothetical protein